MITKNSLVLFITLVGVSIAEAQTFPGALVYAVKGNLTADGCSNFRGCSIQAGKVSFYAGRKRTVINPNGVPNTTCEQFRLEQDKAVEWGGGEISGLGVLFEKMVRIHKLPSTCNTVRVGEVVNYRIVQREAITIGELDRTPRVSNSGAFSCPKGTGPLDPDQVVFSYGRASSLYGKENIPYFIGRVGADVDDLKEFVQANCDL